MAVFDNIAKPFFHHYIFLFQQQHMQYVSNGPGGEFF